MLCRKLTDTPFPFPWVQAVNIALLLFTLLAPIAVIGFTENVVVSTILTFVAVATHVTLNEVASDIEDPFHYDPNELPLPQVLATHADCSAQPLLRDVPAQAPILSATGPLWTQQFRWLQLLPHVWPCRIRLSTLASDIVPATSCLHPCCSALRRQPRLLAVLSSWGMRSANDPPPPRGVGISCRIVISMGQVLHTRCAVLCRCSTN